jgi:streptomycin 3"-adenylyltransferase
MDPIAEAPVATYLDRLADRAGAVLGDWLIGVLLHGSAVLGGFDHERSDLDLLVVVSGPLDAEMKRRLAAELSPEAMPCPAARGLELSAVTAGTALGPSPEPPFELHLATDGQTGAFRVVDGAGHPGDSDLPLHFAVCRQTGHPLTGPQPRELFGPVPRAWLLRAMKRDLEWARQQAPAEYQVLNACRAWRFAEEDLHCSKLDGGRWARGRLDDPAVVDAAIARQSRGGSPSPPDPPDPPDPLDAAAVSALLDRVVARLS